MSKNRKSEKSRLSDNGLVVNLDYLSDKFHETDISDNFVHSIVSGILEKAFEKIYVTYLSQQVIPFTTYAVGRAIIELIEMNFPEIEVFDECVSEDEELDSLPVHSWSQGAISKKSAAEFSTEFQDQAKKESTIHSNKEEQQVRKRLSPERAKLAESKVNAKPIREPIQVREFIPGWSKRPDNFNYKPYTGQLKGISDLSEKPKGKKTPQLYSNNTSVFSMLGDPLVIWKSNLANSVMFDENGHMLATLPLISQSTVLWETLGEANEDDGKEDRNTSNQKISSRCRPQSQEVSVDWSVCPIYTVGSTKKKTAGKTSISKLKDIQENTPTKRLLPKEGTSAEEALWNQLELNEGVTLRVGDLFYSGPQTMARTSSTVQNKMVPIRYIETNGA